MMMNCNSAAADLLFFNSRCQEGASDRSDSSRTELANHDIYFFPFKGSVPRVAHSAMTSSFSCRARRQDEPAGLPGQSSRQQLSPIKTGLWLGRMRLTGLLTTRMLTSPKHCPDPETLQPEMLSAECTCLYHPHGHEV